MPRSYHDGDAHRELEESYSSFGVEEVEVVVTNDFTSSVSAGRATTSQRRNLSGQVKPISCASGSDKRHHGARDLRRALLPTPPTPCEVSEEFDVPVEAPVIVVPNDLPLSEVVLLDAIASAVARGGPSVEEELARREESNSHFEFLQSGWDDRRMLYYRWRLYSLLQGDTLLSWRTAKFQMERGPAAYAWVPPPPLITGSDYLTKIVGGDDTAAPLSERWLARKAGADGQLFVVLPDEVAGLWRDLIHVEEQIPVYHSRCRSEASLSPDALQEHWDAWLHLWRTSLFDSNCISRRMVFAVEHNSAPHHIISLLLDQFLRVALSSCIKTRQVTRRESIFTSLPDIELACAASASHSLQLLWYMFVLNDIIMNGTEEPLTEKDFTERLQNTEHNKTAANYASFQPDASRNRKDADTDVEAGAPHYSFAQRKKKIQSGWVSAVEAVLPAMIESVGLVVMNALYLTGGVRAHITRNELAVELGRGVLSASPILESSEDGDTVRVEFGPSAAFNPTRHQSFLLNSGCVHDEKIIQCLKTETSSVATYVLAWLRVLLYQWGRAPGQGKPLLTSRYCAKLADKYSFLR